MRRDDHDETDISTDRYHPYEGKSYINETSNSQYNRCFYKTRSNKNNERETKNALSDEKSSQLSRWRILFESDCDILTKIYIIVSETILDLLSQYNRGTLLQIPNIYSIIERYSQKISKDFMAGEYGSIEKLNPEYIKNVAVTKARRRFGSWKSKLRNMGKYLINEISKYEIKRDEEGNVTDYGYASRYHLAHTPDRSNYYIYNQLDICLYHEEMKYLKTAIKNIRNKPLENAEIYYEINARRFQFDDLIDRESVLTGMNKKDIATHRHQAKRQIVAEMATLCPVREEQQERRQIEVKINVSSADQLKEIYRLRPALFNPNEKNGDVKIIFSKR
ncbi:MAG: hypothetical protein AB2L22_13285 [Syntrophales bacterium]